MKKILCLFTCLLLSLYQVYAYTSAPVDVTKMSMTEIIDALDKEIITSKELVNIYLDRINEYNELFNAINTVNPDALVEAENADKLREEKGEHGRLLGVPIVVKTNIDVKGIATTAGTKTLKDNMPIDDSDVVKKLKDEGAIIIATTNMSEFAFVAGNSYSSYGHVKNVFNTDYTPFGSSGGSAVSVKAGFAAAGLGTDTNLSVRVPASAAGLVGMRPTLGSVSSTGVIPYDTERDTVGVLTKSVEDNKLILDIISNDKDDKSLLHDTVETDKKYRVGIITQYAKGSSSQSGIQGLTDKDIYALIEDATKTLEASNIEVVELKDFVKSSNLNIVTTSASGLTFCDGFNEYIKGTTGTIRSFKSLAYASGHTQPLGDYLKYCGNSKAYIPSKDVSKAVYRSYVDKVIDDNGLDALVYPTLKNKVPKLNAGGANAPGASMPSVIGYPSITVPMGYVDEFSYGLEFMGKGNSENTLYQIADIFFKANENDLDVSPLTPSLYEIPDSVTKLVELYNKKGKKKKVVEFFKKYNDIEDKEAKAKELIKLYENNYIVYFAFVGGIVFVLYCIYNVLK